MFLYGCRLKFSIGIRTLFVDLGAEKLIAAEKKGSKIAVEIKSFENPSILNDLEKMVGQIKLYDFSLKKQDPDRHLFVAIPTEIYQQLMDDEYLAEFLNTQNFSYILYNSQDREIEKWKKP